MLANQNKPLDPADPYGGRTAAAMLQGVGADPGSGVGAPPVSELAPGQAATPSMAPAAPPVPSNNNVYATMQGPPPQPGFGQQPGPYDPAAFGRTTNPLDDSVRGQYDVGYKGFTSDFMGGLPPAQPGPSGAYNPDTFGRGQPPPYNPMALTTPQGPAPITPYVPPPLTPDQIALQSAPYVPSGSADIPGPPVPPPVPPVVAPAPVEPPPPDPLGWMSPEARQMVDANSQRNQLPYDPTTTQVIPEGGLPYKPGSEKTVYSSELPGTAITQAGDMAGL